MSSRKPVVLMDVDGPLTTGTVDVMCATLRGLGYAHARPEGVTQWDICASFGVVGDHKREAYQSLQADGVAASFEVREGAAEFIDWLRRRARVVACTAPLSGSLYWAGERAWWLRAKLGFDPKDIVQADDKALVKGDYLVDDKYENVLAWHGDGEAVLWTAPYNLTERWHPRVSGFEELRSHFAHLEVIDG